MPLSFEICSVPHHSLFNIAYTSAPDLPSATTADAERQFSEGRNQINWNQHSMSSQTFPPKMCLAAWSKAPWFTMDDAEKIIASTSRPLRAPDRSPPTEARS
ncbi:hypothetical protein DAEQUDRAFT_769611 [Daedalea quercina L-15889]|uniref:HAT C-terminal dimerisation domain-containing protein n=1 Tax=Daedalea quercina L-15889 TaxID=1314783 RepID=A0A165LKZ1_9APHY|nr:hypothetical protein DAEQUDRAFT_769611 [Daedalea quercina L-15889]